jgi:hypothetical protein
MGEPPRGARGLCDHCRHQEIIAARHSRYSLCGLSRDDPRFPKYPRLPVLRCAGFSAVETDEPSGSQR